jgi:20S proteasome alpha/beta subunit
MKTLGVTKVFVVNDFIAAGGSGDADDVKLVIQQMKRDFVNVASNQLEFVDKIEELLWGLHKKYNVKAREYLGQTAEPFKPNLLVGAKTIDGSFGLYLLKDNGRVSAIDDHRIIGSGGDLARLVIKQLNRGLALVGRQLHNGHVNDVVKLACYIIINEVKESDSQSGGQTKVVVIDSNGVRELPQEEVNGNYDELLGKMTKGISPMFPGLSIDDLRKLYPGA